MLTHSFFDKVLVFIVDLLDEDTMPLDGTAIVVESQSVAIRVFIMVEDKFFSNDRGWVKGHKELIC